MVFIYRPLFYSIPPRAFRIPNVVATILVFGYGVYSLVVHQTQKEQAA